MHPIVLKANGSLQGTTLKNLSDVSLLPQAYANEFCLHPDYPDLEIAETSVTRLHDAFHSVYDIGTCQNIQGMHRKLIEATGKGSWPPGKGCHPNHYPHENYHATLFYTDFDAFMRNNSINRPVSDQEWQETIVDAKVWPSVENPVKNITDCKRVFSYGNGLDPPEWRERSNRKVGEPFTMFDMSTWLVLEGSRRVGCLYLEVFNANNHNVHEKMIAIPGSTAGYAYFNNGTCSDHVTSNIDSLLTYSLGRLTALRQHELGHTKNLPHEFREPQSRHRSIMSYAFIGSPYQAYRESGPPYQYVEDLSWPRLRRFFGGEPAKPVELKPDPGSDILPGRFFARSWSGGIEIIGTTTINDKKFIMWPAIDGNGYILRRPPIT